MITAYREVWDAGNGGANAQTHKVFATVAFRLAKMAENNVSLKETV